MQQKWFVDGYVQDTWKATQHLTVNIGLRWEPSLPPGMLNNAAYNFSFPNFLAGVKSKTYVNAPPGLSFPGDPGFHGLAGVQNQWDLFAPRVALAWDPKGDGRMVIRASFGISYDYVNGSMYVNSADSPPFGNTTILTGGQFSTPFAANPGANIFPYSLNSNSPFVTGGTYIAENPNLKTTEVNQWNFVIQRQFGKEQVASATYTGSESDHLLASYDANPTVNTGSCGPGKAVATCPRLFTPEQLSNAKFYNDVDILDSSGTSSYNGMILAIQKRLSRSQRARAESIPGLTVSAT